MAKFLTDHDRRNIADKILEDTPRRDPQEVHKEFQTKLIEAMPPEVRVVYEKYPQALKTDSDYNISGTYHEFIVGQFSRYRDQTYADLAAPYYAETNKRNLLREKLMAMFKEVRTVASLHSTFPDFAKYFPPISAADTAKRKKKEELTAEELQALLEKKRKEEEKEALKAVKSFGMASELASLGWTPNN